MPAPLGHEQRIRRIALRLAADGTLTRQTLQRAAHISERTAFRWLGVLRGEGLIQLAGIQPTRQGPGRNLWRLVR